MNNLPYTISFVIRKRQQIDGFNELPKEKRPTEKLIWDGTSEELDSWFDKVLQGNNDATSNIYISDSEIED